VKIPRYWRRADGDAPDGRRLTAWGWSAEDPDEAHRVARQRLTAMLDRLHRGEELPRGYAYGERPLREEILEDVHDTRGGLAAVVTRNSYGSVVLNAARVMFVDVDLPAATLRQRLGGLLGAASTPESATLTRIRSGLGSDEGSYRIYRTAAGFRVLATDPLFEPRGARAEQIMRALGADDSFVHLCKVQDSFRARLTPKPWRCGVRNPPGRFPRDLDEQAAYARWRLDYDRLAQAHATCRFVEAAGRGRTHEDARSIVSLHDRSTRAERQGREAFVERPLENPRRQGLEIFEHAEGLLGASHDTPPRHLSRRSFV
jgi:hypothetical protein